MSWSFSAEEHTARLRDALDTSFREYLTILADNDDDLTVESRAQVDAAASAVLAIATSGALGEGPVHVSLSGHANPGHALVKGYGNDNITVSLTRVGEPVAPPAPPEAPAEPAPTPEPTPAPDAAAPVPEAPVAAEPLTPPGESPLSGGSVPAPDQAPAGDESVGATSPTPQEQGAPNIGAGAAASVPEGPVEVQMPGTDTPAEPAPPVA